MGSALLLDVLRYIKEVMGGLEVRGHIGIGIGCSQCELLFFQPQLESSIRYRRRCEARDTANQVAGAEATVQGSRIGHGQCTEKGKFHRGTADG